VIVTPEVGLAAAIEERRSGIVAQGDPQALSAAISSLHADARLRAAYAGRGLAMAQAHSWDSIAQRFEQEYRAICDERH